jgi:hypothetical protein
MAGWQAGLPPAPVPAPGMASFIPGAPADPAVPGAPLPAGPPVAAPTPPMTEDTPGVHGDGTMQAAMEEQAAPGFNPPPYVPPGGAPASPAMPPQQPKAPPQGGGYSYASQAYQPGFGYTDTEKKLHARTADYLAEQGEYDKQGAALGAEDGEQKAAAYQQQYEWIKKHDEAAAKRERERQYWVSSALHRHEKEAQALAKSTISTTHWWTSKSTEEQIVAGIGIALMAFGDGLSASGGGRGDTTIQVLGGIIDRDMAAQKSNLESKHAAFAAKRGLYASRLQSFQDERLAEASSKATAWQFVGAKLKAMEARTGDKMLKVQAQKLGSQADFMVQKYVDQIQIDSEKAWQAYQLRQQQAAAAASAEARKREYERDKDDMAMERKIREKQGLGPGQGWVRGPDGKMYVAQYADKPGPDGKPVILSYQPIGSTGGGANDPETAVRVELEPGKPIVVHAANKEQATKLADFNVHANEYISNLNEAKRLAAQPGFWANPAGKRVAYEAAVKNAQTSFSKMKGMGAHDQHVAALVDKIVPPAPNFWMSEAEQGLIDQAIKSAQAAKVGAVSGYAPTAKIPQGPTPLMVTPKE